MDGYPFACAVQVRWRDLDAFGHVNNAVFATYLETARAELWRQRFAGHGRGRRAGGRGAGVELHL